MRKPARKASIFQGGSSCGHGIGRNKSKTKHFLPLDHFTGRHNRLPTQLHLAGERGPSQSGNVENCREDVEEVSSTCREGLLYILYISGIP